MSGNKIVCLYKNRDVKGNIVNYVLKDENEQTVSLTKELIKAMMRTGKYDFVNLQIDKTGRLVDKALPKEVIRANPNDKYKKHETYNKKAQACEDKIKKELKKHFKTGLLHTSDDEFQVKDQDDFNKEFNRIKKAWESIHTGEHYEDRRTFEELRLDILDVISDRDSALYYGYMGGDVFCYDEIDIMYSYNKEDIRKYLNSFIGDIDEETYQMYRHTNID